MTTRLPRIDPTTLAGPAAELYARYTTGGRAAPGAAFSLVTADGQLTGPPAAWMHNPELGLRLEQLGYGVRFELTLPPRAREVVILMVAQREDSAFERFAHHPAARQAGLDDEEIARIDEGRFVGADPQEQVLVRTADALLSRGTLTDAEWSTAEASLGGGIVLEVVTLVGWYRLMALQLRVFGIEPTR